MLLLLVAGRRALVAGGWGEAVAAEVVAREAGAVVMRLYVCKAALVPLLDLQTGQRV